MASRRTELEVRCVLVGWRDVMSDVRTGRMPESRESVYRVTIRALQLLDGIEDAYADDAPETRRFVAHLVAEARAEVQGATFNDLADSGEEAG